MPEPFYLDIPGVISDRIFGPPPEDWQEPAFADDLRACMDWLHGFMHEGEWERRRADAARRLYAASGGHLASEADSGRFFEERDTLGWYLFLCDAILHHPWNYDPMFGSRVLPVIAALGRNLPLLRGIEGAQTRARRLVTSDRGQPNGGLFELLIAAAYARQGAEVAFREERKGGPRTHDLDVRLGGVDWAVECKRMEMGEYGERERLRVRALWKTPANHLARIGRSLIVTVDFHVEMSQVPEDYLVHLVQRFLDGSRSSMLWTDGIASGSMGDIDLEPLREVLRTDLVLIQGTRMNQLLTGRYERYDTILTAVRCRLAGPRYAEDCDLAIVLRWQCLAEASISAKARDVRRHIAEATEQLPEEVPSAIHIGLETVNGDTVEDARQEKVRDTLGRFDPGAKKLEWVYLHYLAPESPPDELLAFDETTQCFGFHSRRCRPLKAGNLVLPDDTTMREGAHWSAR